VLDFPSRSGQEITSRQLIVHGRIAEGVRDVRLILETSAGKLLATGEVDPTGLPRLGMIPFVTTFEVSNPRPGRSLVLYVVPVDGDGVPLDAERLRFVIGVMVDIPARPSPEPTQRLHRQ
jgi:hypothetical protein